MLRKLTLFAACLLMVLALAACNETGGSSSPNPADNAAQSGGVGSEAVDSSESGQILLYGEAHANEDIIATEYELWRDNYMSNNMRHLFIEVSYSHAQFLNLWMKSENDEILDQLFLNIEGTLASSQLYRDFYKKIKEECPETIFHGTDIGHQYDSTGDQYLKYLEQNGLKYSEEYRRALRDNEQGVYYYNHLENAMDEIYRENKMAENFAAAYNALDGASVMGIYGAAHTVEGYILNDGVTLNMITQLLERYGGRIRSEDLSLIAMEDVLPTKVDKMTVNGKEYDASYFGEQDLTELVEGLSSRRFWRLENAFEDFKALPKTSDIFPEGDVLPYNNYPMLIESGQVFAIEYTKTDGTKQMLFYISDGTIWNGIESTVLVDAK